MSKVHPSSSIVPSPSPHPSTLPLSILSFSLFPPSAFSTNVFSEAHTASATATNSHHQSEGIQTIANPAISSASSSAISSSAPCKSQTLSSARSITIGVNSSSCGLKHSESAPNTPAAKTRATPTAPFLSAASLLPSTAVDDLFPSVAARSGLCLSSASSSSSTSKQRRSSRKPLALSGDIADDISRLSLRSPSPSALPAPSTTTPQAAEFHAATPSSASQSSSSSSATLPTLSPTTALCVSASSSSSTEQSASSLFFASVLEKSAASQANLSLSRTSLPSVPNSSNTKRKLKRVRDDSRFDELSNELSSMHIASAAASSAACASASSSSCSSPNKRAHHADLNDFLSPYGDCELASAELLSDESMVESDDHELMFLLDSSLSLKEKTSGFMPYIL